MNDKELGLQIHEDLDTRIESLIDDLSDLLQNISKPMTKSKETFKSKEFNEFDINLLETTLETVAELLERDVSDLYFESLYSLTLYLKKSFNFIFSVNSEDSMNKSSELTYFNVNLNSIWETICYKIEKLVMNEMIRNNLDIELDFVKVCTQLKFLSDLRDNKSDKHSLSGQGLEIWQIFDSIRVCRLESEVIESNERQFYQFLKRLVLIISFDLRLYKSGYFGAFSLNYKQLVLPYIQALKTKFEAEITSLNTDINALIELLKQMNEFDHNLQQFRQEFPRLMQSPEEDEDLFDWKSMIEMNINMSCFHKNIYNKISCVLRELKCFTNNCFNECQALEDKNILNCVSHVFNNFEDFQYLCILDSFMSFLSYAISANVIDFFIHHFNDGKYESVLQMYTLLNSIHYIDYKLNQININVKKFREMSDRLEKQLIAKHVSILMLTNNTEYWVLYLNRLWIEMKLKLIYFENRKSIFECVLSETIHHFSATYLESNEILYLLNNIIDLLLKNTFSRNQLLYKERYNIHNSCWILFIKFILKMSTNEEFITNLKQNNNLPENCDNYCVNHWIQYIRPNLMNNTFWFNAKLCVDKDFNKIVSKLTIRAFLSNNCGFSQFVLTNIECTEANDVLINSTKDIFEVILLQTFRPDLLSIVLLKLIESHESWPEFDVSTLLSTTPRIWWYKALQEIIFIDIDNILMENMKTLINEVLITNVSTEEVKGVYKSIDLVYKDFDDLVEEGLKTLFTIINDLIQTLPITLITSLEILDQLVPGFISPIAKSLPLNVLISSLLERLENCKFLNISTNESKIVLDFCDKLCSRLRETLETEKHFSLFKKTLKLRKFDKNNCLNNEDQEIDIICSLIGSENFKFDKIVERLHSLLLKFKNDIDANLNNKPQIESKDSLTLSLSSTESHFFVKFNQQLYEDLNCNQILDSIDLKTLENEIKLRFDYSSRLALFDSTVG